MKDPRTWPMADLARVRSKAERAGLDVLVAMSVQNFRYLTGYWPANSVVRGLFMAVVPTRPELEPFLTISEFEEHWARVGSQFRDVIPIQMWVEIDDLADLESGTTSVREKPVQFDPDGVLRKVVDGLSARGLSRGRIGYERASTPAAVRSAFEASLPSFEFVDSTELFYSLRSVKSAVEIEALERSTHLAELGIRAVFLESNPRGKTVSQLRQEYEIAIRTANLDDPNAGGLEAIRCYLSTGGSIGPNVGRNTDVVSDGDVVWIDAGVQVDGYASDIGRTFTLGKPNPTVSRIAEALRAGSDAGLPLIKAGAPMQGVFQEMQNTVRRSGLPTYTRGHVGHAVGVGMGEQPPYISSATEDVFEENMVLAYERPYYVRGLGGFQFEENLVVTEGEPRLLTTLPREIQVI